MTVPFVHSNYTRVEGDYYPTIDRRCVDGLIQFFLMGYVVDVCAPDGSGIIDAFRERFYDADCMPDAFADSVVADWIVTNPPYTRKDRVLVDRIIYRQIERVEKGEVKGLAALLRSNFDFAKSRKPMFKDNPLYYGQIKLLFRPWWSESREAQPIHNYVWHIWKRHTNDYPVVMYAAERRCE